MDFTLWDIVRNLLAGLQWTLLLSLVAIMALDGFNSMLRDGSVIREATPLGPVVARERHAVGQLLESDLLRPSPPLRKRRFQVVALPSSLRSCL